MDDFKILLQIAIKVYERNFCMMVYGKQQSSINGCPIKCCLLYSFFK